VRFDVMLSAIVLMSAFSLHAPIMQTLLAISLISSGKPVLSFALTSQNDATFSYYAFFFPMANVT
jgi:uncharacterized membrane protein